jgi:hypothetical protein
MPKNCRPGLDSRCRDNDGEIRHKNGATRVGTLRPTYGDNFARGVRSDMKLDTLLERTGSSSLSQLLNDRIELVEREDVDLMGTILWHFMLRSCRVEPPTANGAP